MAVVITLPDGLAAVTFRGNLISYFEKALKYGFISEKIARSSGTPSTGDPAGLTSISHTISGYTIAPEAILIPKSDWYCYISSVSNTKIVVGVGSFGSSVTIDYDILIISKDIPA